MAQHTQHTSRFAAFMSIRKTYSSKNNEKTIGAHLYSANMNAARSLRYMKSGVNEATKEVIYKDVEGVFLDSITGIVSGVTVLPAKELEGGKTIPESIAVDFLGENNIGLERVTFIADSTFGDHFLRRVPLIDWSEEITLKPYAFYPEGKDVLSQGLEISQGTTVYNGKTVPKKVADNYSDWVEVDGKKTIKNKNGLDQFDNTAEDARAQTNDKLRSAKWKMFFAEVNAFLVEELKKSPIFGREVEVVSEQPMVGDAELPADTTEVPF